MDVRKLRKIVELLDEFDIADFKLKEDDYSVQITRKPQINAIVQAETQPPSLKQSNSNQFFNSQTSSEDEYFQPSFTNKEQKNRSIGDLENAGPYSDDKVIKSPMVGTFYAATTPDADDFITKGQKIETGDTICIIEAMKIMNRIESDQAGVIKEILVKNGEPVQFGQPLAILE